MTKKVSKSKSSKKSQAEEPVLPSLVEAMAKIAERLESLERKTDAIMGRLSSQQNQHRPQQSQPQSSHQFNNQQSSSHRPPQHQSQHGAANFAAASHKQQHHGQERTLYKATCADCNVSCEVPFKPTGERPVYCKECFADRKANKSGNSNAAPAKNTSLSHAAFQQRELRVVKHGVGRVRVSEMVPAAGRSSAKHRLESSDSGTRSGTGRSAFRRKPAKFAKSKR